LIINALKLNNKYLKKEIIDYNFGNKFLFFYIILIIELSKINIFINIIMMKIVLIIQFYFNYFIISKMLQLQKTLIIIFQFERYYKNFLFIIILSVKNNFIKNYCLF